MNFDHASAFNNAADEYAHGRFGYPKELYACINNFAHFSSDSTILEIGAGNGIATAEINDNWHPHLYALEPSENLFKLLQKECAKKTNITCIHDTFEQFTTSLRFDGILSATAFHWIQPDVKFMKTASLLTENGVLAVYWNNYFVADDKLFNTIQDIHRRFNPSAGNANDMKLLQRQKIDNRKREIEKNELFSLVHHEEWNYTKILSTNAYIQLLQSFSHNAANVDALDDFYTAIREVVSKNNNTIEIGVIVNLEVGQKKA